MCARLREPAPLHLRRSHHVLVVTSSTILPKYSARSRHAFFSLTLLRCASFKCCIAVQTPPSTARALSRRVGFQTTKAPRMRGSTFFPSSSAFSAVRHTSGKQIQP